MNRRHFLRAAGATTGYSAFVSLNGFAAGNPASTHDEIAGRFEEIAPPSKEAGEFSAEPNMAQVELNCDFLVAGGGMAGVCAAVAAARQGVKVVLLQDRSRLGGNSSSEVKMHIVGADLHGNRPGWREGGLIEEFRLDDAVGNPQRSWEMWDLLLYDKVKSEPNITLLLDTVLFRAEVKEGMIQQVFARSDKTEHLYRIKAKLFADCTGDCRLGLEAGAEIRRGREAKSEFGESLALDKADAHTLGSSILFTARDHGRPMPYTPPRWARKVSKEMLRLRPVKSWEYGYWWIEWGGHMDTIRDNERIRFELLSITTGVWDYIKNSGEHPSSTNWALEWIGMLPGKRGSRRLVGDYTLTEHDITGKNGDPYDGVAIGGWGMDDHPPSGFDRPDLRPFTTVHAPFPYNIPLRCLYSRNVKNLFMAGRNISATHVAFTSARVIATCSVIGQAAGTAAAYCIANHLLPQDLANDRAHVGHLRQRLLRDDQTIRNLRNEDPKDLARKADVQASTSLMEAEPANVINGFVRDMSGKWENRWGARMVPEGVHLDLEWDQPQKISQVAITFDSGFHRQLTLSAQDSQNAHMIRAPQPETVKDYEVLYRPGANDPFVSLFKVTGNWQRLRKHSFATVTAQTIRLKITATNGSDTARVYELRCYA